MERKLTKKINFLILISGIAVLSCINPVFSFDLNSAAFSLTSEGKDISSIEDVQKIEKLLTDFENDWNSHNIENLERYYSDRFINGDGLTVDQVKSLTKELWDAYPDIRTSSKERTVRVFGEYATVNTTDIYQGSSRSQRNDVGERGTLKALSIGEIYLKKFGPLWKITSDKTLFEKVSIGYGLGNKIIDENRVKLSAPEQVISGHKYTASLKFDLPGDIKPIASIGKELLIYPQQVTEDKFRLVDKDFLERLFNANQINKNELVSVTVGLTGGPLQPKLLGLVFLTRRVNVIPVSDKTSEVEITDQSAKSNLINSEEYIDFSIYENNKDNTPPNN